MSDSRVTTRLRQKTGAASDMTVMSFQVALAASAVALPWIDDSA